MPLSFFSPPASGEARSRNPRGFTSASWLSPLSKGARPSGVPDRQPPPLLRSMNPPRPIFSARGPFPLSRNGTSSLWPIPPRLTGSGTSLRSH
jgi:hypothetical protein